MEKVEKAFNNFVEESELFFVTKFIESEKIKQMYSNCLDIIFGLSGTVDSGRGIIVFNEKYGQGKTFLFDVVQHRFRRRYGKNLFVRTSAKDLCDLYTEQGKEALLKFIRCKNLFIDDIGDEGKEKMFKHYGEQLNVLRWVLLKRYEFWCDKGWKTFGTTNLTKLQIAKEYDGRVADRIEQMSHWFSFSFLGAGKSFRQYTGTRRLSPQEIAMNWKKFEKPKEIEKVDLEKYFNELIHEEDSYFSGKDNSFWRFAKEYMIEKGVLTDKDFDKIDERTLESSELFIREDTRETQKKSAAHAPADVRINRIQEAISKITKEMGDNGLMYSHKPEILRLH